MRHNVFGESVLLETETAVDIVAGESKGDVGG